jgi:hypothetical protein
MGDRAMTKSCCAESCPRLPIPSPLVGEGWEEGCLLLKDTPLPTALCAVGLPHKGGCNKVDIAP